MSNAEGRDPYDSLCLQPVDSARSFHYYSPTGGTPTVRQEVVDALYDRARSVVDGAGMVGDVLGRMRAAARGGLANDPDEFEPVRRQPELWEIKWKFRKVGEFRMYHAEPMSDPELVALRFHEKETEGLTPDEIEALQDAEMDLAGDRYEAGENRRWGHSSACGDCLSD
jgi:hypothetical protein